jgi:hypothetical protein
MCPRTPAATSMNHIYSTVKKIGDRQQWTQLIENNKGKLLPTKQIIKYVF